MHAVLRTGVLVQTVNAGNYQDRTLSRLKLQTYTLLKEAVQTNGRHLFTHGACVFPEYLCHYVHENQLILRPELSFASRDFIALDKEFKNT